MPAHKTRVAHVEPELICATGWQRRQVECINVPLLRQLVVHDVSLKGDIRRRHFERREAKRRDRCESLSGVGFRNATLEFDPWRLLGKTI